MKVEWAVSDKNYEILKDELDQKIRDGLLVFMGRNSQNDRMYRETKVDCMKSGLGALVIRRPYDTRARILRTTVLEKEKN